MLKAVIYCQIPQVIQESMFSYKRGKCLQSTVVLLQDRSVGNSPHSEHTPALNALAEKPLKHTTYLLWGTLLIDSDHLCGAAFGSICGGHMTVSLRKFGWVCGGATDQANIPLLGHLPAHCGASQVTAHGLSALLCLTKTPPGTRQARTLGGIVFI